MLQIQNTFLLIFFKQFHAAPVQCTKGLIEFEVEEIQESLPSHKDPIIFKSS